MLTIERKAKMNGKAETNGKTKPASERTASNFRKVEDSKPYGTINDRVHILASSFGISLTANQEKTVEGALTGWCDSDLRNGVERRLREASTKSSMHTFMELADMFKDKNVRKLILNFNKKVNESDIITTKFSLIDVLGDIAEGSELLTAGELAKGAARVSVSFAHNTHLVQDFMRFAAQLSKEGKIEFLSRMIIEVERINSDPDKVSDYLNSIYQCKGVNLVN